MSLYFSVAENIQPITQHFLSASVFITAHCLFRWPKMGLLE